MAYSQEILHRAKVRLAQAKQAHEEEDAARISRIYREIPRLREIDLALRRTMAQVMAVTFQRGQDPAQAIVKIKEENLALQQERDWLLQANDLEEADLATTPICPICGGSGYIGARMCDCLKELCRQEQKNELTSLLGTRKESFDNFRLDYYSAEFDSRLGSSPRKLMELVFWDCQHYAKTFSLTSPSLFFIGATGLGKTFLSGCIARAVADRGFSVVYDTAVHVFSQFEAEKFGNFSQETHQSVQKYTLCDLLILDDLGTEMTTQLTISALYTLVNSRLSGGLPTIISTNLPVKEVESRYSAPIASRILGCYEVYKFYGQDIRMRPQD
jgi:DNA replication protein DnaC